MQGKPTPFRCEHHQTVKHIFATATSHFLRCDGVLLDCQEGESSTFVFKKGRYSGFVQSRGCWLRML
eukprot:3122975-Amphidinium_carterae.1